MQVSYFMHTGQACQAGAGSTVLGNCYSDLYMSLRLPGWVSTNAWQGINECQAYTSLLVQSGLTLYLLVSATGCLCSTVLFGSQP